MIEIRSLTKRFGPFTAVDRLDLVVERGEVLGFLGPNGAGKTTTMRMVTGFLAPTAGSAVVRGNDVVTQRLAAQRHIGYLPEGAPAWPDMTAAELLDFVAQARGFARAERVRRVGLAVERVQLGGVLHQPVETLSKGFKRRVGLAQAILHDPDVLVLDEPTDGLDPNQKREVRRLIVEMAEGKAIVLSTHILEEVDAVCTRATIMARGKLVADGTPTELRATDPRHGAFAVRLASGDAYLAAEVFARVAGVARTEVEGTTVLVFPRAGAGPLDALVDAGRGAKLAIAGIARVEGRLEAVFSELTFAGEVERAHPAAPSEVAAR